MLATIFMIGLFALAGLFLLKLVFGLGFGLPYESVLCTLTP